MIQNVGGYKKIPFIFASSFFHSILDLRLTSLCKERVGRLFHWEANKKDRFGPDRQKRFFLFLNGK